MSHPVAVSGRPPCGLPAVVADELVGDVGQLAGRGSGLPAQASEGLLVVQAVAFHQDPFGLLDQHPGLQGDLELGGQLAPVAGFASRPQQLAEHPGWR